MAGCSATLHTTRRPPFSQPLQQAGSRHAQPAQRMRQLQPRWAPYRRACLSREACLQSSTDFANAALTICSTLRSRGMSTTQVSTTPKSSAVGSWPAMAGGHVLHVRVHAGAGKACTAGRREKVGALQPAVQVTACDGALSLPSNRCSTKRWRRGSKKGLESSRHLGRSRGWGDPEGYKGGSEAAAATGALHSTVVVGGGAHASGGMHGRGVHVAASLMPDHPRPAAQLTHPSARSSPQPHMPSPHFCSTSLAALLEGKPIWSGM